ncbi:MAG: alpha/beta hydrolase [Janthinobacterium lividum]
MILIIPGGGYDRLTDTREQEPVAEFFASKLHITTFILRYRLVQSEGTYRYPIPIWDGQRALRLLRARAQELGINPSRIAVFGFSAGGHLASTLALHPRESFGAQPEDGTDRHSAAVDLLGLGYPVISMNPAVVPPSGSYKNLLKGFSGYDLQNLQHLLSGEENVSVTSPPTFLFESLDDQKISPLNSQLFAEALRRRGVPSEVHLFNLGEHGSGLSIGIPEEEAWPSMFLSWIHKQWPDLDARVH